ncbi:MAG: orotate phosphoribosyltransferase [Firmicutes bacterium]|nr:orotate phosphoribosyltransferase [Bacillota bacterium]
MCNSSIEPVAEKIARILIEIEAVGCNPEKPFTLTSGRSSPVYVDCRRLISFPEQRAEAMDVLCEVVESRIGLPRVEVVAGGETAGIPYAAFVAARLGLPMVYVRKQAKGFGRGKQVEGYLEPGRRVLLVEDLVFDGGSKLVFCRGIREAGGEVSHVLTLFEYGAGGGAAENLAKEGITLHAACRWEAVILVARATGYFNKEQITALESFLADPAAWSQAHGGV